MDPAYESTIRYNLGPVKYTIPEVAVRSSFSDAGDDARVRTFFVVDSGSFAAAIVA
jgi:hypothetical protein